MSFVAKLSFDSGMTGGYSSANGGVSVLNNVISLGDDDFTVIQADYEMSQSVSQQQHPNGKPIHSIIHLTLESSKKTKTLLSWMQALNERRNGTITFFRRDNISAMRTLKFGDAHCTQYRETFTATGTTPMTLQLKIAAGWISVDGVDFAHPWSTSPSATPLGMFQRFTNEVDDAKDKIDNVKEKTDSAGTIASETVDYTKDVYHSGANDVNLGYQAVQTTDNVVHGTEKPNDTIRSFNPISGGYDDGKKDDKKEKNDNKEDDKKSDSDKDEKEQDDKNLQSLDDDKNTI